jgi:transposase
MGRHIEQTLKEEILIAVKEGLLVSDAATKYGVGVKAIYNWLKKQADNTGTSSLEIARLRRENQELKEIIGMFTLEKKRAEKNRNRS